MRDTNSNLLCCTIMYAIIASLCMHIFCARTYAARINTMHMLMLCVYAFRVCTYTLTLRITYAASRPVKGGPSVVVAAPR